MEEESEMVDRVGEVREIINHLISLLNSNNILKPTEEEEDNSELSHNTQDEEGKMDQHIQKSLEEEV